MSDCGHPDDFDHSACWYGRFSRAGERFWPPCQSPARWWHPSSGFPMLEAFRWCDEHRHEGDVLAPVAQAEPTKEC